MNKNCHYEQDEPIKDKLREIIFGNWSIAGRIFDVSLIALILCSVVVLMLESVSSIASKYQFELRALEWTFTIFFTIEYVLRIYCARRRFRYITSFYGIIDLLAILPTYLSVFITGVNFLFIVRLLRVLRIFKILRLFPYLKEARFIHKALTNSWRKIIVFFGFVLILATLFGSIMYVLEGGLEEGGFTSIPKSIYWTIVTITTVGYGDIVPQTALGQAIAALAMLTGYSIIAVPTGIISSEMLKELNEQNQAQASSEPKSRRCQVCVSCDTKGHDWDAKYCKYCGALLPPKTSKNNTSEDNPETKPQDAEQKQCEDSVEEVL